MKKTSDAAKTKILKKALETGEWDIAPSAPFPRGRADLAAYFSEWADDAMLAKMEKEDLPAMRIRDRVALGVRARLEILSPHRDAVRENLRYLAPPPRHARLPGMVWRTADAIWRAAGDTATDYNHYTKRILLSGVLVSTMLFWLNDESGDFEKTQRFLDRRIENILKIGGLASRLRNRKSGTRR